MIVQSLEALREHVHSDQQELNLAEDEPQTPDYELWLREVVGPTYDLVMEDSSLLIPAEEIIRGLEARRSRAGNKA